MTIAIGALGFLFVPAQFEGLQIEPKTGVSDLQGTGDQFADQDSLSAGAREA